MHQRRLMCERCGHDQWAAGRVIEEAERELSYRWCRRCLDLYGPCAPAAERPAVAQPGVVQVEVEGIRPFFQGLAAAISAEVRGEVLTPRRKADYRLKLNGPAIYHGSKVADHGPVRIVDTSDEHTVVIETPKGRRIRCNWGSISYREPTSV